MILFALVLGIFGLWASSWGLWACWNRPAPHDWLGMVIALSGVVALGLGAAVGIHPGFLS